MEIARALGFPRDVLDRAVRYLSGEGRRLDEVLLGLEEERGRLSAETALLAARRREAEEAARRIEARAAAAREEESKVLEKSRQRIREEARKAENALRAATEELRRDKRIETVRNASAVIREWKEKSRAAAEDPVVRALMSRTAPLAPGALLRAGQKVYVPALGQEAEVAQAPGDGDRDVEVAVGGMKTRVPREQVRVFAAGEKAGPPPRGRARGGEGPESAVYVQTPENTLDLRGMYVDDAVPEIDAFLDRMSLAQAPFAFLIHGHGTGALKSGVRRHLRGSPYARRFLPAPREQGGDGVTIVVLA